MGVKKPKAKVTEGQSKLGGKGKQIGVIGAAVGAAAGLAVLGIAAKKKLDKKKAEGSLDGELEKTFPASDATAKY